MNKQSPSVLGEIRKIEDTLADQNKQIALNQNDTQYIKDTLKDMKSLWA